MRISQLKLDMNQFAPMLAADAKERYRYVDGKRTDELDGYGISVILPNLSFEKAMLKVSTLPDNLTHSALMASGPVSIIPVGNFTATLYQGTSGTGLSLKAETAEVVKQ